MYHSISERTDPHAFPYYRIITHPAIFEKHLRFLQENKYTVVPVFAFLNNSNSEALIDKKRVAITFDDGYKDFYTNAFPLLKKYNYPATVFLPASFIGNSRELLPGVPHLTWEEIIELKNNGITFGSHSMSHSNLVLLNKEQLKEELEKSKYVIEEKLNSAIDGFSFPFAFPAENRAFVRMLKQLLESTGYSHCVTTRNGVALTGDDPFLLRRLPVNSFDDERFFKAKLEGGYNWVRLPQEIFKLLKLRLEI
jgi:peptidoglycan/xylan/chitin deacetylase (PgdA/CDA1 family)